MGSLLRFPPFRALAYRLIDADLCRNLLEERFKREYITRDPVAVVTPMFEAIPRALDIDDASEPDVAVGRVASGGSRR